MKASLQLPPNSQYTVRETEDSHVIRFENTKYVPSHRTGFSISWRTIFLIFIFVLILILCTHISSHPDKTLPDASPSVSTTPSFSAEQTSPLSLWTETGLLFPDSNTRYLDESDIISLSQIEGYTEAELLRYAVNEIYARHHYLFSNDKYVQFFNSYEWYDGYLTAEEASALFNSVEHKNIAFLLDAELKYA